MTISEASGAHFMFGCGEYDDHQPSKTRAQTTAIKRYGTSSMECPNGCYVMFSEYERVVAECERLRADAARYQWIRGGEKDVFCVIGSNGAWGECGHQEIYDDRLDATIDADLAKEAA